jgi:methyl acetate hydrolase
VAFVAFVAIFLIAGAVCRTVPAMRHRLPLVALAACALALGQAPKTPSIDANGRAAISRVLQTAVERGDTAGVVALVVSPDGELYTEASGKLSIGAGTPLLPDAIFRIFSMTKPVTSVAAMILVEEKRLGLDDPISKYLSAKEANQALVTMDETGHFVTRPPATPVTIRQLLTHTSGIAYAFSSEMLQKLRETAPSIPDTSILVHDPGERWTYGPSTKVLGDIVAAASGQALEVFFDERIFKPLGMRDTGFTVPENKRARLAASHERRDGKLVERPNAASITPQIQGDSGLYSTASDYGRFVRMLLNGGELEGRRVLSASTVREMSTNQIGTLTVQRPASAQSPVFPGGGRQDVWGFGFQIARPEKADPKRRAPGSLSWLGAMNTFFWIDPERRLGAVLLTQILPLDDPPATKMLEEFEAAVYSSIR